MIIAILIQLAGALAVCALVGIFSLAKSQDAWMGWAWLLPVNVVSLIYSCFIVIRYAFRSKAKRLSALPVHCNKPRDDDFISIPNQRRGFVDLRSLGGNEPACSTTNPAADS
jgi:hypothetical protein